MRSRHGALTVLALVAVVCGGGCAERVTQTLVIIDGDAEVLAMGEAMQVRVWYAPSAADPFESAPVYNETKPYTPEGVMLDEVNNVAQWGFPQTIPVVPADGDANRQFVLLADLLDQGSRDRFIRQRVRTGFVDGKLSEVRLHFASACLLAFCSDSSTCGRTGACQNCQEGTCEDEAQLPIPR